MEQGSIQQIGTPAEVYARPANRFVAGFLGAPPMGFVDGELDPWGRFVADGIALLPAPGCCAPNQHGRRALLGVRPEHVTIGQGPQWPFRGEVSLVEPMGNHQVVWLRCGAQTLAALEHDGRTFVPGQQVDFAIDATRVSLFDPVSGVRL
jgi:multiple sugar transport system ATP-binding protein